MEFRILGTTEVIDGPRRVDLPGGRGRALLAILALHAGEAVPTSRLIDELWGEQPPATASTVVQGLVSRLRTVLQPGWKKQRTPAILQTAGVGYRLAVDPQAVDAHRFARLLDQARRASPRIRAQVLADALALWRGPALADFSYEPFAQRAITALEGLRLTAIEDRIDADLAGGRHGEVVSEVEQLVAAHPFRERLCGQLMLALYRSGRQAEALTAYRTARNTLVGELGIEPGPALRRLEHAILRQDPALDLTPPALGRAVAPRPVPAEGSWVPRERRTVTVVIADLAVCCDPGIDAEAVDGIARRTIGEGTELLHRHGARVNEAAGGTLLGFFGLPIAHEDDAVRAVRAATELCAAADRLRAEYGPVGRVRFAARAGIDTGEVIAGPISASGTSVSGPVIATAAGLHRLAEDGDVIVSAATQRLIRGLVVVEPSGTSGAWRVRGLVSGAAGSPLYADGPMFGRQQELSRLRSSFRNAVREMRPSRLTVLGEAGIGKTRLAREFARLLGPSALVITGQCPAYGRSTTLAPVRDLFLDAAGTRGWLALADLVGTKEDRAQLAAAFGLIPLSGGSSDVFPAVLRFLEGLAATRPLVVVFEDVHWAEPTLINLIEYVLTTARGPIFLLCLARPELLDDTADPLADRLQLDPLEAGDIEALIIDRTGGTLEADQTRRIIDTARGNPLFAEQLLATIADGSVDVIPASLQGLLAMRLDRLGPGERDLLRCAAVIGTECDETALRSLLPEDAHRFVERHLAALDQDRLIERSDRGRLRFRHVLIQLAAYRSMTREDRARLHEKYAAWLETTPAPPPEIQELVGHHHTQADEHRRAIGAI